MAQENKGWRHPRVDIIAAGRRFEYRFERMDDLRRRERLERLHIESITVTVEDRRRGESIIITAERPIGRSEITVAGRDRTWVEGTLSLLVRAADRPLTLPERLVASWNRVVSRSMSRTAVVIMVAASLITIISVVVTIGSRILRP